MESISFIQHILKTTEADLNRFTGTIQISENPQNSHKRQRDKANNQDLTTGKKMHPPCRFTPTVIGDETF